MNQSAVTWKTFSRKTLLRRNKYPAERTKLNTQHLTTDSQPCPPKEQNDMHACTPVIPSNSRNECVDGANRARAQAQHTPEMLLLLMLLLLTATWLWSQLTERKQREALKPKVWRTHDAPKKRRSGNAGTEMRSTNMGATCAPVHKRAHWCVSFQHAVHALPRHKRIIHGASSPSLPSPFYPLTLLPRQTLPIPSHPRPHYISLRPFLVITFRALQSVKIDILPRPNCWAILDNTGNNCNRATPNGCTIAKTGTKI